MNKTPGNYVTLAFYRDGQSKISRFIRWVTRSEHYSHVEIIVGSVWVTALIGKGVVTRRYKPEKHNEKYDYIRVPVDPEYWHQGVEYINGIHYDNLYDYLGAFFGNMLHIPFIQDPNKFFCSELVVNVLKKFNEPKVQKLPASMTTPQMLWDLYDKR